MPPDYDIGLARRLVITRPKASETRNVLNREPKNDDPSSPEKNEFNGMNIPLNMFLFQEIERMDIILRIVRKTLQDLILGIRGEIIMTPQLQDALTMVDQGKPPITWYKDASGAQIAWNTPALAMWFDGLKARVKELTEWLTVVRPSTFWMTGFFNPQGFLTCLKQEVTRRHKDEKWGLDEVTLVPKVQSDKKLKGKMDSKKDGLYIRGLFMEGAKLDTQQYIVEADPKELYQDMPLVHVTAKQNDVAEEGYKTGQGPAGSNKKEKYYDCPVYTTTFRTDLCYVAMFKLKTMTEPDYWAVRGVAILCSKD
jgi:dynein heavy chain